MSISLKRFFYKEPVEYKKGWRYYKLKNWELAANWFKASIVSHPHHAPSYFKLGMCEFRQARYELSYDHIAQALIEDPKQVQWRTQLDQTLTKIITSTSRTDEEKEEFIKSYLVSFPNNSFEQRQQLLLIFSRVGKWWEEKKQLSTLVSKKEASPSCYFRLGEIKEIEGQANLAFEYIKKAIDLNEQNSAYTPPEWFYRAGYLAQSFDEKDPQKKYIISFYFNLAVARDKTLNAARFGIGVFHQQRSLWKEARDAYVDQLDHHPIDGELHYLIGSAYEHCNQWEEASHYYKIGLAITGGSPKWHYKLAYTLEMQGEVDSAIDAYRYAILTHSNAPSQWRYRLGNILANMSRYKEAAEICISAREQPGLDLCGDNIDISLKEYKKTLSFSAEKSLNDELRKHPDESSSWYSLGKVYEKSERWAEAANCYQKSIELKQSSSAYWHFRLGYTLYRDGKLEEALDIFNKVNNELLQLPMLRKEIHLVLASLSYLDGIYTFWFKLSFKGTVSAIDLHDLTIEQRESYESKPCHYSFTPVQEYHSGREIYCRFDIDLCNLDLPFLYHDYFLSMTAFAEDGCRYEIKKKTNVISREVVEKLKDYPLTYAFLQGDHIVYPYLTASQKSIAFIKRLYNKYDDAEYRNRELEAINEYNDNKEILDNKKAWLIFEKFSNTAQDNAYYFFLDIVGKRENVYYVIDKESPDKSHLAGYENHVVDFMSKEHMLLLLSCELLISSETRGHAYAWRRVFGPFRNAVFNKPYVFLQHGVTAMKRNNINLAKDSHICAADRFVVSSNFEKEILLRDNFGYTDQELVVSGFPRWKGFEDRSHKNKSIFLMPTWRNWLEGMSDDLFKCSDYFKTYCKLLSSDRLDKILSDHDFILRFYIHPKIMEQLKHFDTVGPRVELIEFGGASVRDLLQSSNILITDYSSVAWDFYYLSKPVLFFHFDLDKYLTHHGSHIDLEVELPGRKSQDLDSLLDNIEQMLINLPQELTRASKINSNVFGDILDIDSSDFIFKNLECFIEQQRNKI